MPEKISSDLMPLIGPYTERPLQGLLKVFFGLLKAFTEPFLAFHNYFFKAFRRSLKGL
jgi:hypothetical protein